MTRFPTPACTTSHDVRVRRIAEDDWGGIAALEARAYADGALSEGRAALESRERASPDTCFALDAGGRLAGYLLALPYPMFRCPDLRAPEASAYPPGNLHLHDLVVAEHLRSSGLARRALERLTAVAAARGDERISLVAVGGTAPFWSAHGYRARHEVAVPDCYGAHAVYMSREVG